MSYSSLWPLDPDVVFLNHGSFGSCLLEVLRYQQALRDRLERQPISFFMRESESLLDAAKQALAAFVGADMADLAFIQNASTGVNTVLRSLRFEPGDELLVTDHEYAACRNALDFVASRARATVVVARIPFPVAGPQQVVDTILAHVTPRTRIALVDHITSPTALVFPIREITRRLAALGIDALVDGAHGPGMELLELAAWQPAYYTGNCHKWLCAPKGAGFLFVRRDRQAGIRPLVMSHGMTSPRTDRSRFQLEFDWTGTGDPSPFLCVPEAVRFLGGLLPGGWPALMRRNRDQALRARTMLAETLGVALPCPDEMVGSMATLPLPPDFPAGQGFCPWGDPVQDMLYTQHRIEVPIMRWSSPAGRYLRISSQLYNDWADYERLAEALRSIGRPT